MEEPKQKRKPISEEDRRKMSERRIGVPKSPECRMKIGIANTGKVRTPEMRQAMSDIKRAYWAKRKEIESGTKASQ